MSFLQKNRSDTMELLKKNPIDAMIHIIQKNPIDAMEFMRKNPTESRNFRGSGDGSQASVMAFLRANPRDFVAVLQRNPIDTMQLLKSNPYDTVQFMKKNPYDTWQMIKKNPIDWKSEVMQAKPRRVFGRSFGCEFELPASLNRDNLIRELKARGHKMQEEVLGSIHTVVKGWKVVPDGSLTNGLELVSPVLHGEAGLAEVRKMCRSLSQLSVEIPFSEKQFGFHVHVGVKDLGGRQVAKLILDHDHMEENGLLYCVPAYRRELGWCKKTHARILEKARAGSITFEEARSIDSDRYRSLNMFQRCADYGTVEFRRHGGTLNEDKSVAWILLCLCMVHASDKSGRCTSANFQDCLRAIGMYEDGPLCEWAAKYLLARHRHFSQGGEVQYPAFPANWA